MAELRELSERELVQLFLGGSLRIVYGPVARCDRPAVVAEIIKGLQAEAAGSPAVVSECARTRLPALGDRQLIRVLVDRNRAAALRLAFSCDREELLAGYRDELVGPRFSFPPLVADCVIARLRSLPHGRLPDVFIQGDLEDVVRACRPGA